MPIWLRKFTKVVEQDSSKGVKSFEKCHIPSGRKVDGAAVVVSFAGDPVLGEVADGSGVGLFPVDEEVIIH